MSIRHFLTRQSVACVLLLLLSGATTQAAESELLKGRTLLDQSVWKPEVEAQQHERTFTRFWDSIRQAKDKLTELGNLTFETLAIQTPETKTTHPLGVTVTDHNGALLEYTHESVVEKLATLKEQGWELLSSEWHHQKFDLATESQPAHSEVSILLNLSNTRLRQHVTIDGRLIVEWQLSPSNRPVPHRLETKNLQLAQRTMSSGFARVAAINARKLGERPYRLQPLILHDLNGDGLSEVILGGVNTVHWNQGNGQFDRRPLLSHWRGEIGESAVVADFNGDSHPDFLCITAKDRVPLLFHGSTEGTFPSPGVPIDVAPIQNASAMTAGDIDGDNDLDLYVTQYRRAYTGGQMPTPFYNANDGYPAYLLINDGTGQFADATEAAGLGPKRHRRTYSTSLVDLDQDRDLDLMVVSDFAGVDLYQNRGDGTFTDVRDKWVDQWHNFGMAHTIGDFNRDGRFDFYVIGMSSTTMRRLNYLDLNRPGYSGHGQMRTIMGYGNRLYFNNGSGFDTPAIGGSAARTGWSWGTTATDFDNDGDEDIYVANGFISGESTQDYCTTFWCHDIYTGNSQPNPKIAALLNASQLPIMNGSISWNGYEHNQLLMNDGEKGFRNVSHLVGTALNVDCRAVASDDLNGDGRRDLLVVEERWEGNGKKAQILHVMVNALDQQNNWVGLRLEKAPKNTSYVGATVRLHTPSGDQIRTMVTGDSFYTQHAPVAHFGLGQETKIDHITVQWPNGTITRLTNPQPNVYHALPLDD